MLARPHAPSNGTIVRLLLFLALSMPALSQITYVGNGSAGSACVTGGITNTGTCPVPYAPTPGNGIVGVQRTLGNVTPFVQDNNFISLMQGAAVPSSSGYAYNSFMGFAASGVTSYNFNGYATGVSDLVLEYSGVGSFDLLPVVATCTGTISADTHTCSGSTTITNPSMTFTLDESTDTGLCAFTQGLNNGGGTWQAPFTGTARLIYNTSPSQVVVEATSVGTTATCGASLLSASNYRIIPIIMRPTVVTNTAGIIRQITTTGYVSLTGPANCLVNSTNCKGQIAPPLAGDLLLFDVSDHSDFNDVQRTFAVFFCSANTGCHSGGTNGDYAPTYPGGNCTAYNQDLQPESNGQDTFYALSATGNEGWFDVVRSGANSTNERQIYTVFEIIPPPGFHAVFDGCPAPLQQSTLATSFTMPTATLSGSNEVLIDGFTGGAAPETYSAPYLQGGGIPNHFVFSMALGQNSGTGPTVTGAGPSNGGVGVVRAFKWVANSAVDQVGPVQSILLGD